MAERTRRKSPLGKLLAAIVFFGCLAVGAHMVIKPESYSFGRLTAKTPEGPARDGLTWLETQVGTRPAGGLMAGVGLLGLIVSARPRKKADR